MALRGDTMTGSDPVEIARRLEGSLTQLAGIRGAKVESEAGTISAVRLLVVPERDTESTIAQVRDIASQELGYELDPGTIQVLRTTPPVETKPRGQRRKLASLTTERAQNGFRTRVTLEVPGDVLVGESAVPAGQLFERKSVVSAILKGLADLLEFPVDVDSIDVVRRDGRSVALVTLHRASDRLVGTALVKGDEHDAIARATLDALNRFLGVGLDRAAV